MPVSHTLQLSRSGHDKTLKVWEVQNAELLATFTSHGATRCCALANDGKLIVRRRRRRMHNYQRHVSDSLLCVKAHECRPRISSTGHVG